MDRVSQQTRSAMMAKVKSKDSKPERIVREEVRKLGVGYRLHRRELPGKPDLVFSGRRAVIFCHGCFWHQHPDCRKSTIPATNSEFWQSKLRRNVERDAQNIADLEAAGWRTLVVWECETKNPDALSVKLREFLCNSADSAESRRPD